MYDFGVLMIRKTVFTLILIFSLLFIVSAVHGEGVVANDTNVPSSDSKLSSKALNIYNNPIKSVSISKSTFKAGTTVKIKVAMHKSVKSVSANIAGKGTYKLKKIHNNVWQYSLKTNGYKTGKYKLNIKATDFKKKSHKKQAFLTVDNVAPKIKSLNSNVTVMEAGTPFYMEAITDKTSKKVVAKVRGKTISFIQSKIADNKKYNSSNFNNWTFNGKIDYKEIGTLNVVVNVYDSVGNVAKKTIFIKSDPHYVFWNGHLLRKNPVLVSYPNPTNAYQKSVKELSKYVKVYEGYAGYPHTLGITFNNGNRATKVIIAHTDPFVVYHEMGHVLNWKWTEEQCDIYAYNKVGYWIV